MDKDTMRGEYSRKKYSGIKIQQRKLQWDENTMT